MAEKFSPLDQVVVFVILSHPFIAVVKEVRQDVIVVENNGQTYYVFKEYLLTIEEAKQVREVLNKIS